MIFLLTLMLSCPLVKIVNKTDTWTDRDQKTLEKAFIRCGELYKKSRCLKVFTKYPNNHYSVICGEQQ